MITGVVEEFSERRGDGLVRADNGELLYFHCVSILDGSRRVEPGTRVTAQRSVGRLGRDEVVALRAIGDGDPS